MQIQRLSPTGWVLLDGVTPVASTTAQYTQSQLLPNGWVQIYPSQGPVAVDVMALGGVSGTTKEERYDSLVASYLNIDTSGALSVTASGAGITATPTTGNVVIANTGVTSAVAGRGVGVSAATGAVTSSLVTYGAGAQPVAGTQAITNAAVTVKLGGLRFANPAGFFDGVDTFTVVTDGNYLVTAHIDLAVAPTAVTELRLGLNGSTKLASTWAPIGALTIELTTVLHNPGAASTLAFYITNSDGSGSIQGVASWASVVFLGA